RTSGGTSSTPTTSSLTDQDGTQRREGRPWRGSPLPGLGSRIPEQLDAAPEGVAALHLARGHPLLEPADALLGAAVGEGLGDHRPAGLPLQGVVADGGGGAQALLDVAGV